MPMLLTRRALAEALTLVASPVAAQPRQPVVAREPTASIQPILVMTGEIDGTFARIGSDLSVAIGEPGLRVMAMLSHGSFDNIVGLLQVRGVDLGMVAADTLAYAQQSAQRVGGLEQLQYISKLYDNDVHVIARDPKIRAFADLAGKRVCTDVEGSGTAITLGLLSKALNVPFTALPVTPSKGMEMLKHGEADALGYLLGKPGPLFRQVSSSDGLHMVGVPFTPELSATYLPNQFTAEDYPGLVPAGEKVESLAIGVVLACFGWPPSHPRYRNLARFTQLLFQHLPELQQPPFHPKWREVNLGADVPGWTRFAAAQALLQTPAPADPVADQFETFLHAIGRPNPTRSERDGLWARFLRLRQ